MIIKPIWEDTTYTDRTQSGVFLYHITTQEKIGQDTYEEVTIFNGKAWTAPNDIYTTININHICQDYLSTSLPDIRNITATTNITHKEAYREFTLWDENDNVLEIYRFLLDWSYETKDFTKDINMSRPINGHYAVGMLKFNTIWDHSAEEVKTFIDFANDGDIVYYINVNDWKATSLGNSNPISDSISGGVLFAEYWGEVCLGSDWNDNPIQYSDEWKTYTQGNTIIQYKWEDSTKSRFMWKVISGSPAINANWRTYVHTMRISGDSLFCADWALYYSNRSGGWDSFLIEGNVKKTDNFEKYYINRSYNNTTMEWGKKVYHNEITTNYELHTGWLNDRQSDALAFNLLSSNQVYLHDLKENKIIPVVITNDTAEYKTFKNNGRKMVNYTINVEASQIQQNINN